MSGWILVAIGGAAGSCLRYYAGLRFGARWTTTLWINVVGSLLIGIVAGAIPASGARTRLLFGVGFLGGFTTFSTFELETLSLVRSGNLLAGLTNIVGTVALGYIAVVIGYTLGTRLTR